MNDIVYRKDCKKCDLNKESTKLPQAWVDVFQKNSFSDKKKKLIELWRNNCAKELSLVISFIEHNLLDIELIRDNERLAVLYKLRNDNDEIVLYEGFIPQGKYEVEFWEKLPQDISKFYSQIHNGFFEYKYTDTGLLPLENIECLDDYDWGIIEDLNLSLEIDIKNSYMFFSSGSGGYVVLDTNNISVNNATIWFARRAPKYNKNMWDFVDEWLVLCMN